MRKKTTIISALSIIITLFTSCLESNDPYPVTYPTMGTVTDLTNFTINSDSYGVLIPENPDIVSAKEADSIGQRVFVNITFPEEAPDNKSRVSTKKVNIFELFKALTKDANDLRTETSDNQEDFGDAPIQIIPTESSAYISEKHLNLEFFIRGENTKIPHRISLLLTEDSKLDDEGLLRVELKHNSFSDGNSEKFWGIASFTLSSIPECNTPEFKGFRIFYKNLNNINTELKVLKASNKSRIVRSMESSEEIGYGHSFLSCELQ